MASSEDVWTLIVAVDVGRLADESHATRIALSRAAGGAIIPPPELAPSAPPGHGSLPPPPAPDVWDSTQLPMPKAAAARLFEIARVCRSSRAAVRKVWSCNPPPIPLAAGHAAFVEHLANTWTGGAEGAEGEDEGGGMRVALWSNEGVRLSQVRREVESGAVVSVKVRKTGLRPGAALQSSETLAEVLAIETCSVRALHMRNATGIGEPEAADAAAAAMGALALNRWLEFLDLRRVGLGNNSNTSRLLFSALASNQALRHLNLDCNELLDEAAEALGGALRENQTLANLCLRKTRLGDSGGVAVATGIASNPRCGLTSLDMDSCELGDAAAMTLARAFDASLRQLKEIRLDLNDIGDVGGVPLAEAIGRSPAPLEVLTVGSNRFTERAGAAFGRAVMRCSGGCGDARQGEGGGGGGQVVRRQARMRDLDLRGNLLGDDGGEAIAELLASAVCVLRHANLSHAGLQGEGGRAVVGALERNVSVEWLNLSGNKLLGRMTGHGVEGGGGEQGEVPLSDAADGGVGARDGIDVLCRALDGNKTLTWLNLSGCEIGVRGGLSVGRGLTGNRTLKTLYLGGNSLAAEGAAAVCEALEMDGGRCHGEDSQHEHRDSSLEVLDLADNRIGTEGAKAISQMLERNSSLTALRLNGNYLLNEGGLALLEALRRNKTIKDLALRYNRIPHHLCLQMHALVSRNCGRPIALPISPMQIPTRLESNGSVSDRPVVLNDLGGVDNDLQGILASVASTSFSRGPVSDL